MFTASEIKDRVHYLTGVQFLYDTVNPDQIVIPQFILQHDKEVRHERLSESVFIIKSSV